MNTPKDVWKKRIIKEKNLVTDQPGAFILFLGVFISVALGFTVRSLTQSKILNEVFAEATKNIGNEWKVSFGQVKVFLREGWLPSVGLEIDNLTLSSDSECYGKPSALIENAKIPISFFNLILFENPFSELQIQKINLAFVNSKPQCHQKTLHSERLNQNSSFKNKISLVDKIPVLPKKTNQQLRRVKVETVNVSFKDKSISDFSLSHLIIENKSDKPKIITLKTQIDLSIFLKSMSSEVKTELNIEYSEFPEKLVKVNILGGVREGHFSISLLNRLDEKKYQIQSEVKNLPIQKIMEIPFLNIKEDMLVKSGWVSFSGYSEGSNEQWETSRLELKRVKIDGKFGDITSDEIIFPRGIRRQPDPFYIQINNLNLDTFFEVTKLLKTPDQIYSFGILNGNIRYADDNKITYQGRLEGLAFNFSSNGLRQNEKINRISFAGDYTKDSINFRSTEIFHLNEIPGFLNLSIKKDKYFILTSELQKISLSPKTSKLLTHKDTPLVIDKLFFKATGNKNTVSMNSRIDIESIANDYLSLSKLETTIHSEINKEIQIHVKAAKLGVEEKLVRYFSKFGIPLLPNYSQVNLNYSSDYDKSLWKLITANKWKTSGGWNHQGVLTGNLMIPKMEFVIQGSRDEPQFHQKSN